MTTNPTQHGYDQVAADYAARFNNELDYKPFDRHLLNLFVELTHGQGTVCDIGCGPGQIARYLHDQGAQTMGIDLSPGMIEQARQLHPAVPFQTGDMRALPLDDETLAGITAFYSIIHIPRPDVVAVLREFRRVLQPGGWLLAFHIGDEVLHLDKFFEKAVSLDFAFVPLAEMRGYLETAGFTIKISTERAPYEPEHAHTRGYILAQKPSST
jgi:ubiquinone/menaquinone biosynthesis C-methylase UbiE